MQQLQLGEDKLTIVPLGAGREVGRSSIFLSYRGHFILLDCGSHPSYHGLDSLPFFDAIPDPKLLDAILISHFHTDHCAAVPWFLSHTNYQGNCYMTHETYEIMEILLQDSLNAGEREHALFEKGDLANMKNHIEKVNFLETKNLKGMKFTPYPAGHVIGACMWLIDINGVRVLYTGDYSLEDERHLPGAKIPAGLKVDVVIMESTHGTQRNEKRTDREYRFITEVDRIVRRGGRCIIPVFALGQVQELLLILEEYWTSHPENQKIPIYFGSNLTNRSLKVYMNYSQATQEKVVNGKNRFEFNFIKFIRNYEDIDDSGPCVAIAAPGLLQSGLSRTIFEKWCSNSVNGIILPGYASNDTLVSELQTEPKEITSHTGQKLSRNLSIVSVSFSGHADFTQACHFLDELKPKHVILVHGGHSEIERMAERLRQLYPDLQDSVFTPDICEPVEFEFKSDYTVTLQGKIAKRDKSHVEGILVRQNFSHTIVTPSELSSTQVDRSTFNMSQTVYLSATMEEYMEILKKNFKLSPVGSNVDIGNGKNIFVHVEFKEDSTDIKWTSDPLCDMIADSIALILSLKPSKNFNEFGNNHELFIKKLEKALQERFDKSIQYDPDAELFLFSVGETSVLICNDPDSKNSIMVECKDSDIKSQIEELALNLYHYTEPFQFPDVQFD